MTSTPKTTARRARKVQVGKVTSAKMDKSITVVVERKVRHPVYEKYVRRQTKLHAHDDGSSSDLEAEALASRQDRRQGREVMEAAR
jgi:hypothetical protein